MSNSPRERTTASVHALIPPSTHEAFTVWAQSRGLSVSAAVRALINDALWREWRDEPLGALYGDLPAGVAQRIVERLSEAESDSGASRNDVPER